MGPNKLTIFQVALSGVHYILGVSVVVLLVGGAVNGWMVLSCDVTTLEDPLEVVLHTAAFSHSSLSLQCAMVSSHLSVQ